MKLQLKRSNVLDGGSAKEPTASQLDYGELAVNYNAADPKVFIKDSANNVIKVSGGDLQDACDNGGTTTTGATFGGTLDIGGGNIELNSSGAITAAGTITGAGAITASGTITAATFSGSLPYGDITGAPTIPTNNNQLTNGAGYVTSSGNTVIGTDSDLDTSGSTIIDNLYMTDGVITSHGTRTLTLGNLGYTGATNANYITNNNQLTNGASYITSASIPTNNNQLTNGASYITSSSLPTNNNQLTNGAGYYKSGNNVSFGTISASGAITAGSFVGSTVVNAVVTSSSQSASAGDYVVVTADNKTITLPSSPSSGQSVTVVVGGNFLATTVARNSSNIMGIAQDLVLDLKYANVCFTYTNSTQGWTIG